MKELTRWDYKILGFLKKEGYTSQFKSVTLQEIMRATNNSRPTTYRKMMNLCEHKYVGKGCKDINADTFYLLEKGERLVEAQEPDTSVRYTNNNNIISYDNDSVRNKLSDIIDRGLMLKAIAVNAGISESELSRFKSGVDALKESDMKLLADYLNVVYIPRWNKGEKKSEKPRTEKVKSTRHWLFA